MDHHPDRRQQRPWPTLAMIAIAAMTNGASAQAANSCFHQSGATSWSARPDLGDKQSCYYMDSCRGGVGESGGGCYKWAASADAEPEPWTFECATAATPTHEVAGVYILPEGETPRADGREAMVAVIATMQAHYLYALGRTFTIADQPVTSLRSSLAPSEQTDWVNNYRTIAEDCRNGLAARANFVVSAPQGTTGAAGGSWNATKMTSPFWDEAYDAYMNRPHTLARVLHGWSHEFGHGFGLAHTYSTDKACWSDIPESVPLAERPSLIMYKTSDQPSVYDYPFTTDEKAALLDPASAQSSLCLPVRSGTAIDAARDRPHPSVFLNRTRVQSFDLTGGSEATFVWMAKANGKGSSLRKVSADQWREADAAGIDTYSFAEESRAGKIVTLHDRGRAVWLKIDLDRMKVHYANQSDPNFRDLYDVLWAKGSASH